MSRRRGGMRMGFRCWRCGERATAIKTLRLSPTLMEAGYQCININCGHTFVVALEAIRSLNPGAFPQPPGVNVPLSAHVERRMLREQLELAPTAVRGAMGPLPDMHRQLDLLTHGADPPGHGPDG